MYARKVLTTALLFTMFLSLFAALVSEPFECEDESEDMILIEDFDFWNSRGTRAGSLNVGFLSRILYGQAMDVFIMGDYAYVCAGFNLLVFDVSDKADPQIIGTGELSTIARTLEVVGSYAYVADTLYGLVIFDISDPTKPQKIGDYQITEGTVAVDLSVAGSYAYIANYDYSDPFNVDNGFLAVDVSNPFNPIYVGGYTGFLITGVSAIGSNVYAACPMNGLRIIDMSDPSAPVELGYDDTIAPFGVDVFGDIAYMYEPYSLNTLWPVDVTDPSNPVVLTAFTLNDPHDVYVMNNNAFVANGDMGLSILDVSDPSNPIVIGVYNTVGYALNVNLIGNYACVADSENGIVIFDVSDPTQPLEVGSFFTGDGSSGVVVEGNIAFIAGNYAGLGIYDVTDPSNPSEIIFDDIYNDGISFYENLVYLIYSDEIIVVDVSSPQNPWEMGSELLYGYSEDLYIDWPYAYVAIGMDGVSIVDINNPSNPTEVFVYDQANDAYGVHVSGDYLYIADGDNGLNIVDVSNPLGPIDVVTVPMPDAAMDVFIKGDYAYVAINESGMRIVDISVPTSPTPRSTFNTNGNALDIFVTGGHAYVADGLEGMRVIDVNDALNPSEVGYYDTDGNAEEVFVYNSVAYVSTFGGGLYLLDASEFSPPQIGSTFPEPDSINISLDTNIIVNFTEGMNTISAESAFSYTNGTLTWDINDGNVVWTDGDKSMTFTPDIAFDHDVEYQVTIEHTASDKEGNSLDGDGDGIPGEVGDDDYTWLFTTVPAPPQIISTFPEDGMQDVFVDSNLIINFSKAMNTGSVESAFSYSDGMTTWYAGSGAVIWSNGDTTFTFTPGGDLQNGVQFWVNLSYTAMDTDGILLDGDGDETPGEVEEDNYIWEFTTIPSPPKIDSTIPQDDATFILVNVSVIINFNKVMDRSSTQAAFSYTDGSITFDSSYGLVTWSNDDRTMTFKPFSYLENEKEYTFTIEHTAMDINLTPLDGDNDGIGGEGPEDDYSWDFSTIPTPPTIDATYPEPGDQDVKVNSNIIILFSKPMDRVSVQNAFNYTDGITEWGISDGIVTWSDNDRNFTFTPSSSFDNNLQHWITITHTAMDVDGVFLDVDGDHIPGEPGEDDYTWSFTTIPLPPQIITTSPLPGSTFVPINSSVIIEFSKRMDTSSAQAALSYEFDGITFGSTNGHVIWSDQDRTLTFTPLVTFQNEVVYIFKIAHTATDIDGIEFDGDGDSNGGEGVEDDYIWSFTTMPVPPKVMSITPKKNAVEVAIDTIIEIKFTNPMNESSVEDAFTFTHEDTNITWDVFDGNVSWDEDSEIMTFEPSFLLEHDKEYTIKIEATAKDTQGITLDGNRNKLPEGVDTDDYTSYFLTIPEPPKVESVQPLDGLTDVAKDADIVIIFDRTMNRGSTEKAFSYIYEGTDDGYDKSDGTIEWTNNDRTLTFNPDLDFEEGERYTVTIDDSARDEDGIAFEGYEWSFTIKVNSPPILAGGGVFPEKGDTNKMFKFSIIYTDNDDERPESIEVIIDDIPNRMIESDPNDEDYTDGKNYEFELSLDEGDHKYYFEASDEKHDVRFPAGMAKDTVKVTAVEKELIFGFLEEQYFGMPTLICGPIGIIFIIAIIISLILIMRKGKPSEETMAFEPFEEGAQEFTFMPTGEEEIMSFTAFEEAPSLEEAKPVLIQCPECEKHLRVRAVTRPFMFPCNCGAKLILK